MTDTERWTKHGVQEHQGYVTPFERQLDLTRDPTEPGRYRVEVGAEWNCPEVPQGGLMAALAARAMATELAREGAEGMALRSLTTVFAAPVPAGPVTADVTVLRKGRSMSQAVATVTGKGAAAGHTTVAVFGRSRPGFEFTDLTPPSVPGPHDCLSYREPPPPDIEDPYPGFRFFDELVEGRTAMGHLPWDTYAPATSECAAWYRFDEPPVRADGVLDPLALVALCDTMPSTVRERLGPDTPAWHPPSADLTVHIVGEARSEWILGHKRARRSSDGYASIEVALWDRGGRLVAHGSQIMFFVFADGPPPAHLLVPADQR